MNDTFPRQVSAQEKGGSIDFVEIVTFAIARGWHWIVLCGVIGTLFGVGRALSQPNVYASGGSFLVFLGQREKRTPESAIGEETRDRNASPGLLEEVQILNHPSVYTRLAEEIGPERILAPYDPMAYDTPGSPLWKKLQYRMQAWLFRDALARSVDPDPDSPSRLDAAAKAVSRLANLKPGGPNSRLLRVSGNAHNPELARDICSAFMRICQERHKEFYRDLVGASFVDKQLAKAEEDQLEIQQEFYEHRDQCGFYDIDQERTNIVASLQAFDDKLFDGDVRLEEIAKELETIEAEMGEVEETVENLTSPPLEVNPERKVIQTRLDGVREYRAQLRIRYKEESTYLREWLDIYDTEEKRLMQELQAVPPRVAVGEPAPLIVRNPDYVELQKRKDELLVEKERIEVGQEKRRRERELATERLSRLVACEPVHRDMQQRMSQAAGRVRQFRETQNKEESLALLDLQENMGNLQVLEEANYRPTKVGPKRAKTVLSGVGGGFGAGFAIALLLQLLDRRLRYPKSIERALGVRVLGVIPEHKPWRRMGRRVRKDAV